MNEWLNRWNTTEGRMNGKQFLFPPAQYLLSTSTYLAVCSNHRCLTLDVIFPPRFTSYRNASVCDVRSFLLIVALFARLSCLLLCLYISLFCWFVCLTVRLFFFRVFFFLRDYSYTRCTVSVVIFVCELSETHLRCTVKWSLRTVLDVSTSRGDDRW